ncbi:hypothetical protein ACVILL_005048 [Bradyrhizobium sp. USDA 3364]
MIRKSAKRFSLAANAKGAFAEIMLKSKDQLERFQRSQRSET